MSARREEAQAAAEAVFANTNVTAESDGLGYGGDDQSEREKEGEEPKGGVMKERGVHDRSTYAVLVIVVVRWMGDDVSGLCTFTVGV
jgi:hypothetical protein